MRECCRITKPKIKKTVNPEDGLKYTVCGEFFPEVYPDFRSQKWGRGDEDPLTTEMRLFCACTRWAFNRLLEGRSRKELKKEGQKLFGINSRFCDDAVLKAKATGRPYLTDRGRRSFPRNSQHS